MKSRYDILHSMGVALSMLGALLLIDPAPSFAQAAVLFNIWYHGAATYDGSKWQLFLNGNLEREQVVGTGVYPTVHTISPVAIGSSLTSQSVAQGFSEGAVDEVRIWNYPRTLAKIGATMNSPLTAPETGLLARWGLDEGSGTALHGSAGTSADGAILGTNYSWVAGKPLVDHAPGTPTLNSPANASSGISISPALSVGVTDADASPLRVKFYGRPKAAVAPNFTVVVLPDAQNYTAHLSGGSNATLKAQTQWIVNNRSAKNIVYVTQLGDLVNDGDTQIIEWQRGDTAMGVLENASPGIPFGISIGNHDYGAGGVAAYYNQYFGTARFAGKQYYGGHYGSNNNNHYELFSSGGLDFIVVSLAYFDTPVSAEEASVLHWADTVLRANSSRRAIIVSHAILSGNDVTPTWMTQGQAIYDSLKDCPNVFLMLCGHADTEVAKTDTYNGKTIYTLRSDYQTRANGGNGWMRIMEFSDADDLISVQTYSPTLGQFEIDASSQFTLPYTLNVSAAYQLIGEATGVSPGSNASVLWPALSSLTEYEWFAVVSDGVDSSVSPSWTFTTEGAAGSETIAATTPSTDYQFPASGVTMNFGVLPAGGGQITGTRHNSLPPGPPTLPNPPDGATFLPLWFEFTSTIPAQMFNGTVEVDVSGIPGFGSSSRVMYYNDVSSSWISQGGTFAGGVFTFSTSHFGTFAFVTAPAGAFDVFLNANPEATTSAGLVPNASWDGAYSLRANDWGFTGSQPVSIYVVPQAGATFGAADLSFEWDPTMLLFTGADFSGSVFSGPNLAVATWDTTAMQHQVKIHAALTSPNNVTASSGNAIVKLDFLLKKPGHCAVSAAACDIVRQGEPAIHAFVTPHQGEVRAYLGDVASGPPPAEEPASEATGDGQIDFQDLAVWTLSYWSGIPGYPGGMDNYKSKYDIGPTEDGYIFTRPVADRTIGFEDLIIFSITYGLNGGSHLPKHQAAPAEPLEVFAGNATVSNGETRVPVCVRGTVRDLRGMSLSLSGQFGALVAAEPGVLLQACPNPVPLMSTTASGKVLVDWAIAGNKADGLKNEGEVLVLRFDGKANVRVSTALARNSQNGIIPVTVAGSGRGTPTSFGLSQNYPNPFNPSTMLEFQIPVKTNVELTVYNVLGERVASLVNEIREPGFYQLQWNGTDDHQNILPSGVYFYKLQSEKFLEVKKMLFLK